MQACTTVLSKVFKTNIKKLTQLICKQNQHTILPKLQISQLTEKFTNLNAWSDKN